MKIGTVLAPISFALASLVFIPAAANAQTGGPTSAFPAKGEARYVGYFTGRTISEMKFGEDSYTLEEEVGVTRNLDGHPLFDQMSVRCLGGLQIIGGTLKVVGMCTKTDRDGDVVVSTYEGVPPRGGTHTIVSGTGKYQGIKGTAPYTLTIIKPPGPSLFAFTADHKVSWEITK
jgi:hypothetical protein